MIGQANIKNFLLNFLWKDRENRTWWMAGIGVLVLEFVVFKAYYPFANYTGDSYYYLDAAASNADVGTWPVAYSKFLRLVSVFAHSDTVLVALQFLFLQSCKLFFLFSLIYWVHPGIWIKKGLFLFVIIDPMPLYVANYVGSDSLFIGLSVLWLSSLVWVMYRPGLWLLTVHALLLLACFAVRYNAIYYPGVSLVAFLLSPRSRKFKIAGLACSAILLLWSVLFTSQKMEEVTGKRQFSAFGGWQLANNALYMYEHIPPNRRRPMPKEFEGLEKMVREHMDTLVRVKLTQHDIIWQNFYLWDERGPLIHYQNREFKNDRRSSEFKKWACVGPLYEEYAIYLIRQFPLEYVEQFMMPNMLKFAVPPAEFMGMYNMGLDSVARVAKDWFQYKSPRIAYHNSINQTVWVASWYPVFGAIANALFMLAGIGVFLMRLTNVSKTVARLLILMSTLWLLNFGFSVFSAPIVLRYQLFPVTVFCCVGSILAEKLWKMA